MSISEVFCSLQRQLEKASLTLDGLGSALFGGNAHDVHTIISLVPAAFMHGMILSNARQRKFQARVDVST